MTSRTKKKPPQRQGAPLPDGPLRLLDAPLAIVFRGIRGSAVATVDGPWLMLRFRIGNDTSARYYAAPVSGDPSKVGAWECSMRQADVFTFHATDVIVGERLWPARELVTVGREVDPLKLGE